MIPRISERVAVVTQGWSLSGRRRQAQQLKCRVEGMPEYNRWHSQVDLHSILLHCTPLYSI